MTFYSSSPYKKIASLALVSLAAMVILSVLVWQGLTAHGAPDPLAPGVSPEAAIMNTGILVFREGLEAILVLAALTASLVRGEQGLWRPVALGAGLSLVATVATWFVVVAIVSSINAPMLDIQAGTGLLAIGVLLIIMNWFFHRIYWGGWIALHNRRKKNLTQPSSGLNRSAAWRGLVLVGLTAVYREGFEVVLFLQSLRLRAGSAVISKGVAIGLALTALVAILTFIAHWRLPYRKMLVLTGILLGGVLLVMVGESVQEMQQAAWCSTTPIALALPDWMGTWFAVFPTAESLGAQVLCALYVLGAYFLARRTGRGKPQAPGALPLEPSFADPAGQQ